MIHPAPRRLTPWPPLRETERGNASVPPPHSIVWRGGWGVRWGGRECRESPRGTTLLELIVALAVLGIVLGVSTAALGAIHRDAPLPAVVLMHAARMRALRAGVAVRLDLPAATAGGPPTSVFLLPDGRVIGAGFDPLSGEAMTRASR